MKKLITTLLLTTLILSCFAGITASAKVGDVIGTALNTDIVAYINHYAIPSYAVNGQSVIVAEDLRNFGFDVAWDGYNRTLTITRNGSPWVTPMNFSKDGAPNTSFAKLLSTDIKVYASGIQIPSYAINGYTMIPMEALNMFGEVYWVANERAIKLWVDGLTIRDTKQVVDGYEIFAAMDGIYFSFTSGVGGWSTNITINKDGSFSGQFHDSNIGETGYRYPNGTVYICNFKGRFSAAKKLDEYRYSMTLEYIQQDDTKGRVYYQDGIKYIVSYPYGFDDADKFIIYLPGTPLSMIDEGFMFWSQFYGKKPQKLPDGYFGIYNIGGEQGFVSH